MATRADGSWYRQEYSIEIMAVQCPRCNALPRQRCKRQGSGGSRYTEPHRVRVVLAEETAKLATEESETRMGENSKPKKWIADEEIDNIYAYHPPTDEHVRDTHEQVRSDCLELARKFNSILPDCPEKTILIRQKIREVMMYANAIIACNGIDPGYREYLAEEKAHELGG